MKKVLREKINTLRVQYLIDTYTFESLYLDWTGTKIDAKREYDKIIKYLYSKLNPLNDNIKYSYTKNRNDGRMYGERSIQTCPREIRGFLCEGICNDLDIKNCHPICLLNVCNKHNIECPNLKEYCEKREDCLNRIAEVDNITLVNAKKKILVATNWCYRLNSNSDFLKNYDKEVKIIQKKLQDVTEYDYLKEFAKKEENFNGSFLNHILCVEENKLLQLIINFCEESQIEIHALMFDGIMIYEDITEGFLRQAEDYITNNSDYKQVCLTNKKHDYSFDMPDDYIPIVYINYDDIKVTFDKTHCKVGALFVSEQDDIVDIYKKTDFITVNEELVYTDKKNKVKSFLDGWFLDTDKRKYSRFDVYPKEGLCPKSSYNLWVQFPVEAIKLLEDEEYTDALEYFKNHILVLCNYEEVSYDFVIMWLAQMLQYPEHKSIELIFISKEGTGKGLLLTFLRTMLGKLKILETCDPQNDIFGTFNGLMKDSFLVVMNEANKSNFYNANDKKKGIITDPTININIKGIPNFTTNSYHRFITFSNNPAPLKPNKRRDMIIRCSDDKIGNEDYFNEGFKYANDIKCSKYIYDWLMTQKTSPKINDNDIPKTDYHDEMELQHADPIEEFINDYLQGIKTKTTIAASDLFALFKDYCNENYIKNEQGIVAFGMKIMFMGNKQITKQQARVNGKIIRGYTFDTNSSD
tara:strand:- start:2756 stop:4837 length:2082 start_codon:yes stop_codon:yes gene_type:complete